MHKSILLIFAILTITLCIQAQNVIQLYPGKAPGSETWNWSEKTLEKNAWNTTVVLVVVCVHTSLKFDNQLKKIFT